MNLSNRIIADLKKLALEYGWYRRQSVNYVVIRDIIEDENAFSQFSRNNQMLLKQGALKACKE